MSRLHLMSRLDLYNSAPDNLKQFVAKKRDDYLTPVFLAAYLLDHRYEGRNLKLNKLYKKKTMKHVFMKKKRCLIDFFPNPFLKKFSPTLCPPALLIATCESSPFQKSLLTNCHSEEFSFH